MKNSLLKLMPFLLLSFIFSSVGKLAYGESLILSGSTTFASTLIEPHKERLEDEANIELYVNANGSSRGIRALLFDEADAALISAPIEKIMAKLKGHPRARKFNPEDFEVTQLGESEIVFAIHKETPIDMLTKEDLKNILSGRINSWEMVHPSIKGEIIIFVEYKGGGHRTMVETEMLDNQPIRGHLHELINSYKILDESRANKIGLYVTTRPIFNKAENLKEVGKEASFNQPLFIVSKGKHNKKTLRLIKALQNIQSNKEN